MRQLSIQIKLLISFFIVLLGATTSALVYYRYATPRIMFSMADSRRAEALTALMEAYYAENQSLDRFDETLIRRLSPIFGGPRPNRPAAGPRQDSRPGTRPSSPADTLAPLQGLLLVDANERALIPFESYAIGDPIDRQRLEEAYVVSVQGETIGYIGRDRPDADLQLSYFSQASLIATGQLLGLATLITFFLTAGIALILSRNLAQPIIDLTRSTERMAQGELSISVPVKSKDELGQLTEAFNQMSADLKVAIENRKRMTAEIAHDLGNPLQIVYGYVEAMEDGVMELTSERFETVVIELERLQRMINDLNLMAQADAQSLQLDIESVEVSKLLAHMVESYTPLAQAENIELLTQEEDHDAPLYIRADRTRLIRVLGNLLSNALRYTPSGGTILLSAAATGDQVSLAVRDSGTGIEPEHLPYIFEQFYQVGDADPHTQKGKMGLGLAICKALIEAMDGHISVRSNDGFQGTEFRVELSAV